MIHSKICEILGIRYPVFQGGMAWIADGRLAAAVSGAGAVKILIPSSTCGVHVAGTEDCRLDEYIRRAVDLAEKEIGS